MSKILLNQTASPVSIGDTGVTVPASGSYTIPPTDYLLFAASSHVVQRIADGTLVVNDGSTKLSVSDGVDLIKMMFARWIVGGTDGTRIGNVGDRLKVDSLVTIVPAPSTFGAIFKRGEVTIAAKTETDLSGVTYTVPGGKVFVLTSFNANYDGQTPVVVRFKKQTGGVGAFVTEWRLTLKQHGQDVSNVGYTIPYGIVMGSAGDVFKVTYESALAKGSLWAAFTGVEY